MACNLLNANLASIKNFASDHNYKINVLLGFNFLLA